jgi:hypothetical protein
VIVVKEQMKCFKLSLSLALSSESTKLYCLKSPGYLASIHYKYLENHLKLATVGKHRTYACSKQDHDVSYLCSGDCTVVVGPHGVVDGLSKRYSGNLAPVGTGALGFRLFVRGLLGITY